LENQEAANGQQALPIVKISPIANQQGPDIGGQPFTHSNDSDLDTAANSWSQLKSHTDKNTPNG